MGLNMNYRCLGKTGLQVSEIGFDGEWLERHKLFLPFEDKNVIQIALETCGMR